MTANLRKLRPEGSMDYAAIEHMASALEESGAAACAVGHAPAIFPGCKPRVDAVADVLGIPRDDARDLFGWARSRWQDVYHRRRHADVTRHDVAAALRRYAREGAWWR